MSTDTAYVSLSLIIIGRFIIFIASAVIFCVIVCSRGRKEFLYIATPICFGTSGLIGVYCEIALGLQSNSDDEDLIKNIRLILAIHYMFYTIGHQFFASQYL